MRDFRSSSNFNTEYTKHQHILDTKDPYWASNKLDSVIQMLYYVHYQTAIEMKYQYLKTINLSSAKPGHPSLPCKYSLGSQVENCPIPILSASMTYGMKDLEVDIRIFLHNQSFPPEEG